MTLAECPPGSLSDEMVATVTAPAMDYKVRPGGNVLELVKPAGGGSLLFGTLGPAEAPPPAAQISFWADDEVIQAGQCTTLHWEVENVQAVWVYPQGQPYEDYPMTGKESHQVCPETTTTYEMRVLLTDGNVELRQVTVNVEAVELPPAEISFSADQTVINQGECTTLRWQTANVKGVWVYPQGQPWDQYPVEGVGSQEVCPENTSTYEMRTQLVDDQIDLRQLTIEVQVEEQDPLQNTAWLVTILNSQPPLPDTELTLNFGGEGTANGNAGCNDFNGAYTVSGEGLVIGPLTATQRLCAEEINAQERAYLSALQAAGSFSLEGNQLIIRDNAGLEILRLDRVQVMPL
jgi:heat shock protein HslJ